MKKDIERLLLENLALKPGEKLLVFTDLITSDEPGLTPKEIERREKVRILAQQTAEVARIHTKRVLYHEYNAVGYHGIEPPLSLWRLAFGEEIIEYLDKERLIKPLMNKEDHEIFTKALEVLQRLAKDVPQVVVALSNYSTTHTSFRKALTELRARYASMPLFDVNMLDACIGVDQKRQEEITLRVARLLSQGEEVEIEAPNGTRLTLSIDEREGLADTGNLSRAGAFGNLPAGEAFIAPVEGTAQGIYIAEWGNTRKLNKPSTFHIEKGEVVKVEGDLQLVEELEGVFHRYHQARNIAELGIGTNEKAFRADNILEAEKIAGTIHIALGDNSTFGGRVKVPFHQDYVLFNPTLYVHINKEKILILENGKFRF